MGADEAQPLRSQNGMGEGSGGRLLPDAKSTRGLPDGAHLHEEVGHLGMHIRSGGEGCRPFQFEQMPEARPWFPQGLVSGVQSLEISRDARDVWMMPRRQGVELVLEFPGMQPWPARFAQQREEILRSVD